MHRKLCLWGQKLQRSIRSADILKVAILFVLFIPLWAVADSMPPAQTCNDVFASLNKKSFHEAFEGDDVPLVFHNLKALFDSRSATDQVIYNRRLEQAHARKEMPFQTKNEKTGYYDKFVSVPVTGEIAPIRAKDFDRLIDSTAPVLRSLRKLLQKVYSGQPLTVEGLGLTRIPKKEAELLVSVIKDSVYLEPQLFSPEMANYPFLPVAAFDGAVVDPKSPKPEFFEINSGTPSGLSNNVLLLEELADSDPELYRTIEPYLPDDSTFQNLKYVIDSSAQAWTGKRGMSVVISPGVYNAAHSDVAMIAKRTGMPLVRSSDLYEDPEGNIRLNQGMGLGDQLVTGIYGRMEESFFLQSQADGIPMINPSQDNSSLSAKLGIPLRQGAVYEHVYNDQGEVVDVKRDEHGAPQFLKIWDTMGHDPNLPDQPVGSFRKAVVNRKLYYSAIGGRVADDKRLFRIVSKYLVRSEKEVARPIESLGLKEYFKFYDDPKSFVVKVPNNSGGVGIYFPRVMPQSEVEELIERVRTQPPGTFEIQYVSDIVTLPSAQTTSTGMPGRSQVAIDLRLFSMMDAKGRVLGGSNSLLLRTAAKGALYSNTSRGGGYGIGVVLLDRQNRYPSRPQYRYIDWDTLQTPSQDQALAYALETTAEIQILLSNKKTFTIEERQDLNSQALSLSYALRETMGSLSHRTLASIGTIREFAQSETNTGYDRLRYALQALQDETFRFPRMGGQAEKILKEQASDPIRMAMREMPTPAVLRTLEEPGFYNTGGDSLSRRDRVEVAEYMSVDDPAIQALIDRVKALGGEVRLPKNRLLYYDGRPSIYGHTHGFFWVSLNNTSSSYLIPVVAVDLAGSRALPSLAHEVAHLEFWMEIFNRHLAEGMEREAAARLTENEVWTPENQLLTERRAVDAEMKAERDHELGPYFKVRAAQPGDRSYVNRIVYPEFEAFRQVLRSRPNYDRERALTYMRAMVDVAVKDRQANPTREDIFTMLSHPYGIERLNGDKTTGIFEEILLQVCEEREIPRYDCVTPMRNKDSLNDMLNRMRRDYGKKF